MRWNDRISNSLGDNKDRWRKRRKLACETGVM